MTRLLFCDYHNMVAILEKGEHNSNFHPMVDFLEASPLRRNLKLRDEDGISSLPDAELFENLTLMGYNIFPDQKFTFQKGQFSHQWKYLIHTIMQCLSPKSTGFNEFSSTIGTALVCLATNRTYNFSKMIFDGLVKNINNKVSKFLMYLRTRNAQSFTLPPVADEPASPVRDVSQGEACPNDSSFITDQDRATIAKSSTLTYDLAPTVTSSVADEGSMQPNITELTVKERVKVLEDREGIATTRSGDDVPIKGRSIDEGEAATERISDDTEEMETVLNSIDAATVLAGGIDDQQEREDKRMSEQRARDAEVARIHAEEELQKLPLERRIELISDLVKYQENYANIYKFQSQQRRSWTKKQKRDYYMAVIRNNLGWKESLKKLKSSKEVIEEAKSSDEIPKEKIKETMLLIPIKEVYVEALQVKHPIIDWKVHKEGQRSNWKIIRLGGSSACYQFFVDLLKHLDREDLNQLWILVKEYLSIRPALSDKEIKLWVELKRLYEPDPED
nr:synaptobrevin, longin-like domain protein [Tanacetum cinerariifolium]GEY89934.1 synaptobrevin, longin-like domain protein [Tanacetum cinerariifolium]